jgi:hypothetical protein
MGDQFGIRVALHEVTNMLATVAIVGVVLCIAFVVLSVVMVARGRARGWDG